MNNIHTREALRAAYESGQEKVLVSHNEMVESLKHEILIELKKEIKTNFSTLLNSSSLTPRTSKYSASAVISTRRRRLFGKSHVEKRQPKPLMYGTSESLSPSLGNIVAAAPTQRFWLYLSRISRDVTVEQVRALASRRLGTDDIEVVRLIGQQRDISTQISRLMHCLLRHGLKESTTASLLIIE